jgi:urocanate hydratase
VVRQNQEGKNWEEHVIYNKLIMQQLAWFPNHTLRNHGRCVAALLRVGVETVEYGKSSYKKKAKRRGTAHKVQLKRKNGFYNSSIIIGVHIEYYTNLNTLALSWMWWI